MSVSGATASCVGFNVVSGTIPPATRGNLRAAHAFLAGDADSVPQQIERQLVVFVGVLVSRPLPIYDDSEPVLQRGPLVDQPLGLDRKTFGEILAETM